MTKDSIKASALGTQPGTLGRNHGLQDEQHDCPTVSQQPNFDGEDSSDDEFPAIDSKEFKKIHRRWCESECIPAARLPQSPGPTSICSPGSSAPTAKEKPPGQTEAIATHQDSY
jgi:hypothetical protein